MHYFHLNHFCGRSTAFFSLEGETPFQFLYTSIGCGRYLYTDKAFVVYVIFCNFSTNAY